MSSLNLIKSFVLSLIIVSCICLNDIADAYYCVVIEDAIPSPFTDQHCIEKIQLLLSRHKSFSVEISASNKDLVTKLNNIINDENQYIGYFKNEGSISRAFSSFKNEGLKQGATATITTALGYCAWNIVDNFRKDKFFNLAEWIMDITHCGKNFNIYEMVTQSLVWGGASGVVNGGLKAYKETKIIKWTYSPLPQDTINIKSKSPQKATNVLKADL